MKPFILSFALLGFILSPVAAQPQPRHQPPPEDSLETQGHRYPQIHQSYHRDHLAEQGPIDLADLRSFPRFQQEELPRQFTSKPNPSDTSRVLFGALIGAIIATTLISLLLITAKLHAFFPFGTARTPPGPPSTELLAASKQLHLSCIIIRTGLALREFMRALSSSSHQRPPIASLDECFAIIEILVAANAITTDDFEVLKSHRDSLIIDETGGLRLTRDWAREQRLAVALRPHSPALVAGQLILQQHPSSG